MFERFACPSVSIGLIDTLAQNEVRSTHISLFTAALAAILINPVKSALLAYISGTLGVLISADIFRIKDVDKLGTPFASNDGTGTFDGIFMTGVIAVLLTYL